MNNKSIVKSSYNKIADKYLSERNQFDNTKYLQKLANILKPNSKILDLGCGAGKPVDEFFLNKDFQVTGIDLSEEQIKLAKSLLPKGNFEVGDIEELKPNQYSVDAIVSFYAIFHINREKHPEIFKTINSFLPVDGYLLVSMGSSQWEGKEEFFGEDMFWSHHDAKTNLEIVKKAGFEIIFDEIDNSGGEKHQIVLAKKIS